jgi:hypothetical protein
MDCSNHGWQSAQGSCPECIRIDEKNNKFIEATKVELDKAQKDMRYRLMFEEHVAYWIRSKKDLPTQDFFHVDLVADAMREGYRFAKDLDDVCLSLK